VNKNFLYDLPFSHNASVTDDDKPTDYDDKQTTTRTIS